MQSTGRFILYILIFLLLISIYKDLSFGNSFPASNRQDSVTYINQHTYTFDVVKVQVQPGDTLLSIVESLNTHQTSIQIRQIIEDFKKINPFVDPYDLRPLAYYYFPVY